MQRIERRILSISITDWNTFYYMDYFQQDEIIFYFRDNELITNSSF